MRKLLVLVVVAGVVLTACGSDSKKSAPKKQAAPVALSGSLTNHSKKDISPQGAAVTLDVEQDDFYFGPTFVKAAPGATVTVHLKNEGKNQHTFTIDALGIDETLDPGKTATVEVKMPDTGAYQFYCRFHVSSGMQGAFYTADGAKVLTASASVSSSAPPASAGPTTSAGVATTTSPHTTTSSGGYGY